MGAWGTGIFEDDTALDFLAELRDSDDPLDAMRDVLEDVVIEETIEYEDACGALVTAAILNSALGGVPLGDVGDEDDLDEWIAALDRDELAGLRGLAASALGRVLSGACELYELWSENETDFPAWKAGVEKLRRGLAPPSAAKKT